MYVYTCTCIYMCTCMFVIYEYTCMYMYIVYASNTQNIYLMIGIYDVIFSLSLSGTVVNH